MKNKGINEYKFLLIVYLFAFIIVGSTIMTFNDSYLDDYSNKKNVYLIKDEMSNFGYLMSKVLDNLDIDLQSVYATKEQLLKITSQRDNIYQLEQRYIPLKHENAYRPIAKKTVVFLVNQKMVKEEINSWKDLKKSNCKVAAFCKDPSILLAASISEGSNEKSIEAGKNYFSYIKKKGRIIRLCDYESENQNLINIDTINNTEVSVLWDYQAAYIIKHINRDLVMKVPSDGTLETTIGLASNAESEQVKNSYEKIVNYFSSEDGKKALINNGFRTLDGHADRNIFPDESKYSSAKTIDDNEVWNQTIMKYHNGKKQMKIRFKLFLTGIIVVISTFFTIRKWPYRATRKYMTVGSVFMLLWLTIRFYKTVICVTEVEIISWYAYFIPIQGIIITWTFMSYMHRFKKTVPPYIRKGIIIIGIIFSIVILTNNFHNMIFDIDILDYKKYGTYGYNYGYFIFMAWIIILTVINIYNSIKPLKRKDKKIVAIYLSSFLPIIIYYILYDLKIISWDFTTTSVLLIIFFREMSMRTVFFRQLHMTQPFFKSSSLVLGIYNLDYELIFVSNSGKKIESQIQGDFIKKHEKYIDKNTFCFKSESNIRYLGVIESIDNGYFLSMENIDSIIKMSAELKEQNKLLEDKKEYLDKEKNVLQELKRLEIGMGILNNIEKETENSLIILKDYIKQIYSGKDISSYADKIYLISRYIKQKAQVSVMATSQRRLEKENVSIMIEELIGTIINKNLDIYFSLVGKETMSAKSFIALEELIYYIIIELYDLDSVSMFARILIGDDGITVTVNLDLNSKDMIELYRKLDDKRHKKKIVTDFRIRNEADSICISGFIPEGGRKDEWH